MSGFKSVIFLDIDGVLQPGYSQDRFNIDRKALKEELAQTIDERLLTLDEYDVAAVYCDWNKKAVEFLRELIKISNAEIIISSTWRRSKNLEQLKVLFKIYNLDTYVLGITKDMKFKREEEIQQYLNANTDIGRFVILDDDYYDLRKVFPNEIVPCPGIFGEKEFEMAKSILMKYKPDAW